MRILLLSMPDSFEHTPVVAMRMPNAALISLAGNVDAHHRVAVADLILVQRNVHDTVVRLMREIDPDLVGLSVMTFQRRTALRIVRLIRSIKPSVRIVMGGLLQEGRRVFAPRSRCLTGRGQQKLIDSEELTFEKDLKRHALRERFRVSRAQS